jgi:hypothetical protein
MSAPSIDRLYRLLPAVYRLRDSDQSEPLRALLGLIEQQYDAIEQNISGLYENWFIETCDEWVVPYIGDLLGVRPVNPVSPGTFSARAYVAHTLDYRRRKGTAAMLEQLARDVTGWPARVVEYFALLATTQYLNHLRPQNVITPDLRDTNKLELLCGPFEAVAHTADVRHISTGRGRYNIPNIGLYLWRLQDYLIGPASVDPMKPGRQSDARAIAAAVDGRYTFDPLGLNAPLLNLPQTKTDETLLTAEINVPGLLRRRPLYDELEALRQAQVDGAAAPAPVHFGRNPVFEIALNGALVSFDQVMVCDISDISATDWRRPPASKAYTPSGGGAPVNKPIMLSVDPVRGRIAFPAGVIPASVEVSYVYGFSGDLGAGPYDRSAWLEDPAFAPGPIGNPNRWQVGVSRELAPVPDVLFPTLEQAVQAWNNLPAGADGVITLCDNRTYQENPSQIEIPEGSRLLIIAADWPALRQPLPPANKSLDPNGLRPHLLGQLSVQGTAPADSQNPGQCFIDGLLIEGSVTVAAGNLGAFGISHTTVVPSGGVTVISGTGAASDNQGLAANLYRTICGPVVLGAQVPAVTVTDSIVASGLTSSSSAAAIAAPGARVNVQTSTVFGTVRAQILNASDTIFTGLLTIERQQTGCIRFCYVPSGSQTPGQYRCQPDLALAGVSGKAAQDAVRARVTPQFTSIAFGQPSYAQLASACAVEISTGADNEAEMGAFNFLQQPQRRANLAAALDEYLRFGLEAGAFEVT